MPLGVEVGLSPGHIMLDGDLATPSPNSRRSPPIFGPYLLWPYGWLDQDATWWGVGLNPNNIVLDRDPAPPKRCTAPSFWPMSILAKQLDG